MPLPLAALSRTRYNTVREVGTVTVASYLAERGLPVPEVDLVAALDEMLGDRLANPAGAPFDLGTGFPRCACRHARARGGHGGAGRPRHRRGPRGTGRDQLAVPEAAERLGIDASRVRRRIAAGSLAALRVGRANRLPAWQFIGGRALPHLRALLGVLPADLHPEPTAAFVTSPQPELELSGRWVSPHEWLASGGEPRPVLELAHALGQPR